MQRESTDHVTYGRRSTDQVHEHRVSDQQLLRQRLDREANLLVERFGWVVSSQAFLFSGYAIAVNANPRPSMVDKSILLLHAIPLIGLGTLLLLQFTTWGGVIAQVRLHRYVAMFDDPRLQFLDMGRLPRVLGLAAPLLLPLVLSIVWIVLWLR
jgi:hypothetical protein